MTCKVQEEVVVSDGDSFVAMGWAAIGQSLETCCVDAGSQSMPHEWSQMIDNHDEVANDGNMKTGEGR